MRGRCSLPNRRASGSLGRNDANEVGSGLRGFGHLVQWFKSYCCVALPLWFTRHGVDMLNLSYLSVAVFCASQAIAQILAFDETL